MWGGWAVGMGEFCRSVVNATASVRVGSRFVRLVPVLIPLQLACLLAWWFYQSATVYDPEGWWHPLHPFSIGTCVLQWGMLIAALLLVNRWLGRRIFGPANAP